MTGRRKSARGPIGIARLRSARMRLTEGGWRIGRLALCVLLCAMLGGQSALATEDNEMTPCMKADAATAKQVDELRAIKKQRFDIPDAADLKPWMKKVKKKAAQARVGTNKALEICRADEQTGPRARQAAISHLKKRLRLLDETDEQMTMMRAFEKDPYPRIDPSVLRVLEK